MGSLKKGYEISFPEKVQHPLGPPLAAGTYTIGTGGDFPTIDSAFNKLSIDGIAGEIVLELIDNLYTAPTTQYGFLLNGPIPGSSSRVTIRPAENKNIIIENNGGSAFTFINTNYVTCDGIGLTGATTLTFHTFQNAAYQWNDGIDFLFNSDHNVIQNIIFIDEDYNRGGGGIGFWNPSASSFACDSNLAQNNFIKESGIAIYVSSMSSTAKAIGNIVRGNIIGSDTDSLFSIGIQLEKCRNTIVENNIVQNIKTTRTDVVFINIGINSYCGEGDVIRNNIVHGIKNSASYTSVGILLSGDDGATGSGNQVYNNMVYDIRSTSNWASSRVAGIQMWYQSNPKIYYNSVYLSGKGANKLGSAALNIYSNCTNVEAKNNIFANTRDESPYCASAIYNHTFTNLITDYNDLYIEPSALNCMVKIGSIQFKTILEWQATGKDFHSTSVSPCFCSPDLHIDCNVATCLEKRGTPIAGFDTDFDGDLRNVNLPDIGADEFAGMIPTGALNSGAYSVGTTGFFPSIESVFNRLSADGIAGPVTLELTDDLYTAPTNQNGFFLNGPIPGAGTNSRVTIKPADNKNVIIEGSGFSVLSFLNTSYVTLNGVDITGATTLTIHSIQNNQFNYNMCASFINNSDHNIIQETIFICEDIVRGAVGSVFYVSTPGIPFAADSNLIQNNFIKEAGIAVLVSAEYSLVKAIGNIIRENIVGSETDSLISWGIQAQFTQNTIIENNIVQNIRRYYWKPNPGINSFAGSGDIIRNNVVHNIYVNTGAYGGIGILLSGDVGKTGSNNLVYNNMVYDIRSSSTQTGASVGGIQMWYQDNPEAYYNSVYLNGNGNGANPNGSAAFYISESCTNVDAKNNIFINTRDESPYCASAIYDYSASNLTTDYNDLFYEPNTNNALVRIGNTKYKTLADWQATGKDLNSVTEMPNFITPCLHVKDTVSYLESRGTPIAGISMDFDDQLRNTTNPDIGADEFNGVVVGVEDETPLPTEFALEQNYPNPFNPTTKITFSIANVGTLRATSVQLKVFDLLGREVATLVNEEKPAGSYEISWDASKLSSGVYFYRLQAGDPSTSSGQSFVQTRKMLMIK